MYRDETFPCLLCQNDQNYTLGFPGYHQNFRSGKIVPKLYHDVQSTISDVICKFHVVTLIGETITLHTFGNFYTLKWDSHDRGQLNALQLVSPYNLIENLSHSLACDSSAINSNDFEIWRNSITDNYAKDGRPWEI